MKSILLFLTLLIPTISYSQVNCFQYAGGVVSCDTPRGNTTQVPLNSGGGIQQGILQTDRDTIPYTVMPSPSRSYSSRPIEPLRPIDPLPRLHDDPLNDPLLRPLLLGE